MNCSFSKWLPNSWQNLQSCLELKSETTNMKNGFITSVWSSYIPEAFVFSPVHSPAGIPISLVPLSIIKSNFIRTKCIVVPKGTRLTASLLICVTFYFEIALDLYMSCKNTREFQYTLHPAPSSVIISHNHSTIIKTRN